MIMSPPMIVVGTMTMITAARGPEGLVEARRNHGSAGRPDEEEVDGAHAP